MGNAVTCSLVDVVGTVSVTQTDGQILEFVQPIFASQVKKLHPGNWLVHYVSVQDPASGKHHGKMSMLQGNEELQTGQIYFLLPIPSHFRKQLFDPSFPTQQQSSSSSNTGSTEAVSPPPPPAPKSQQQLGIVDGSTVRTSRQEPTPVFALPGSSPAQQHHTVQQPSRTNKRCKKHKIHVYDWRPSLMTIEEAY
jgi:hypothetical protein